MSVTAAPRFFAVVPAAGRSRRMGQPKLLLPWRGRTVIEHVLAAWQASRVCQVVVVIDSSDHDLKQVVEKTGVAIVQAVTPPDMKASILCGLEYVRGSESPADHDAWLVAPADLPLLHPEIIDQVIAAYEPANPQIVVPAHNGRRGHPLLLPWALADVAAQLPEDAGLNQLLAEHPVHEIEAGDEDMFAELDTPEDYGHWKHRRGKESGTDQP